MAFSYESGVDVGGRCLLGEDIELPQLVLKRSALEHNLAVMKRFCASSGAVLAPHVKTTMAPYVIRRQLEAGVWAVTVATVQQARECLDLGAPRVLLANELVSPDAAKWLGDRVAREPSAEVLCLVDSPEGARRLARGWGAAATGRKLPVLVEVGKAGGRAGCRTIEESVEVARTVASEPALQLVGAEGFEGIIGRRRTAEELARVDAFVDEIVSCARHIEGLGLFEGVDEVLLSAGGSLHVDRVAAVLGTAELGRPVRVVLRSGCYVTHDHGHVEGGDPLLGTGGVQALVPALELWADVLSRPEPTRAIAGFGRRHAPTDTALPVPLARVPAGSSSLEALATGETITSLNDQHAYVDFTPGSPLAIGDRLVCGIVHPCGAFDRWRSVLLVDDGYRIEQMIETLFT